MSSNNPRIPVCPNCGSSDIVLDAWAAWSVELQSFDIADTFENGACSDCNEKGDGHFRHVDWKDIDKQN